MFTLCCPSLFAIDHCGRHDFQGTYGILASGAITVPGFPITGPFARAGQVVADGNGNATFNTVASYNGGFFTESITATYQVFPNCTIEFHVDPFAPIFQPAVFDGVIADNKHEVEFMIVSPPGQTIHATLTKQSQQHCSAASLAGSYALNLSGSIISTQPPILPGGFVRLGKLVANGRGHFTANTFANYNGFQIAPEEISGTYAVAGNCTVTLQYKDASGKNWEWDGALIDNSNGADLIVNEPGTAINGTLKQQ
jgi:hypothetical protein